MSNTTTHRDRCVTNVGLRRWRRVPSRGAVRVPNLSVVRIIARSQLFPGVVVWAQVPFVDGHQYKIRPAVVVSRHGRDVTVLPCTSAPSRHRQPEQSIELEHLGAAGLSRATAIRRNPITVDVLNVLDLVGALSDADAERAMTAAAMLGPSAN